jgi:hypothetical protein
MSSELLLELPGKVVKVFSLQQAAGGPLYKAALAIVQNDSISVAHVSIPMLIYIELVPDLARRIFSVLGRERKFISPLQLRQKDELR